MPAFVFPGQGAQRPQMGKDWTDHPSWELVDEASDASGRDVARLLLEAGEEELTETRNAQLATFCLSLVILDAVERLGIEPTRVAGHSVGEYTALAAAGVIGFEDAVKVVAERGEAMQAAADAAPGVMAIVSGTDADTVDVACRLADGDVWLANMNSAHETVIAGTAESVAEAATIAVELGAAKVRPAPVGGAFHTPLMAPARDRLRKVLATVTLHDADTPVVANVDGRKHERGEDWRRLLSAQLCSPVRWRQSVLRLGGVADDQHGEPERLFVELGPGGSLSAMVRRVLPSVQTVAVSTPRDLDVLVEVLAGTAPTHLTGGHQGELLYVSERVVISPAAGVFQPVPGAPREGEGIEVGTVIGTVAGVEVLSPFAGTVQGLITQPGERVQAGQPVAWLHT